MKQSYKVYLGNFKESEAEEIENIKKSLKEISPVNDNISFRALVMYLIHEWKRNRGDKAVKND
jgi:hypothetical protein